MIDLLSKVGNKGKMAADFVAKINVVPESQSNKGSETTIKFGLSILTIPDFQVISFCFHIPIHFS